MGDEAQTSKTMTPEYRAYLDSNNSSPPNKGTGMSLQQYIRSLREGEGPKVPSSRGGGGGGASPWPAGTSSVNMPGIMGQLFAQNGLMGLATELSQLPSGRDPSFVRDQLFRAAASDARRAAGKGTYQQRNKARPSNSKAGAGMGMLRLSPDVRRRAQEVQSLSDQRGMAKFLADIEAKKLRDRVNIISQLMNQNRSSKTTDTATREELVNIAGRPEKRSLSSSQTKDNSMDILQQIMRMI